jgi:putative ABC transport system permease protein
MRSSDVLRVGGTGLRTRPMRAFLSALGIAIGIAAMVAVVGLSSSSQDTLNRQLAALGTNLLTVTPGRTVSGTTATLSKESEGMISRISPVQKVAAVGTVPDAKVYRSDQIPEEQSGGISVRAAKLNLLDTITAKVSNGTWFNGATQQYPATVLGATAADRLGIGAAGPDVQVYLGGQWFTVIGILDKVTLAPELDTSALTGWTAAEHYLLFDSLPTIIYTRSDEAYVNEVQGVLAATANPESPGDVDVSKPSDALTAQAATSQAFTNLLLGLGAVALLVGGVGVANTMVISVLERRVEIGLRRSLGATRGQIRLQFLAESLLLSALGGIGGAFLGILVTSIYATIRGWSTVVPAWATYGGFAATLAIGALAGLYPAIRASRLAPTEALSGN